MFLLRRVQKTSLCNCFYQRREGNLDRIKTATFEHKLAEYNHEKREWRRDLQSDISSLFTGD